MEEKTLLDITWRTILKICLAGALVYFLYLIRDIIVWLIFALTISILFNFLIDFLEKKKIPRILAVILVYVALFSALGFFIYQTAPIVLSEFRQFSQNFPVYIQKASPILQSVGIKIFEDTETLGQALRESLEKAGQNIFDALAFIFGGVSSALFIISLAFFLSLEKRVLEKTFLLFFPQRYKDHFFQLWPRCKRRVSGWFLSRIIGVIFVGGLTYLALAILNVRYAFLLALIAGILDFIPIIGPAVGAIVLTAVAALSSLFQALFVFLSFLLIQQLESTLLFPVLFKKFVGLSPVLVLLAIAIGGELWGMLGAVLAIPLTGIIAEVLKEYFETRRKEEAAEIL